MKRDKKLSCLLSVLFSVLIAVSIGFGGICCMVTAFGFPMDDLVTVLVFCLLFATAVACGERFIRKGWVLFLVLAFALPVLLYSVESVWISLEAVLYRITSFYNMAYGTGVIGSDLAKIPGTSLTAGLCVIGGTVMLVQIWTVSRRHNAILAVVYGILPLASCLVVTDTVPADWALFLLLTGLLLLILTQSVRRRSEAEGNRLTAMLLIPACLLTLLMFRLLPREEYKTQLGGVQQTVSGWFENLPWFPKFDGVGTGVSSVPELEQDLTHVGPNEQTDYTVMNVVAPQNGMLYLRGQAYDVYTGTSWSVAMDAADIQKGWPNTGGRQLGQLEINTLGRLPFKFFPYYVSNTEWTANFAEGMLQNPDREQSYSFWIMEYSTDVALAEKDKLNAKQQSCYLGLPEDTRLWAEEIASELFVDPSAMTTTEKANRIGQYVSQSASYNLQTEAMPAGQTDFARWFLQESETGYCVHFATTAAVLLRGAGIPARYVTGYLVWASADKSTAVSAKRAHAWVEYYDADMGWRILEATPSNGQPEPPEDIDPTETTAPLTTTEPSETTLDPVMPTLPPHQNTTTPGSTAGTDVHEQEQARDMTWLLVPLKIIAWVAAMVAVLWLQYRLRRRWRQRRMYSGSVNTRALARWREVLRMCRILRVKPPETLLELAEKAKFSQHRLAPEELRKFDAWLAQAGKHLSQHPLRLLYKLLWAV